MKMTKYIPIVSFFMLCTLSCSTKTINPPKNISQGEIFPVIVKILKANDLPIEHVDHKRQVIETGYMKATTESPILAALYAAQYGENTDYRHRIIIEQGNIVVKSWMREHHAWGDTEQPLTFLDNEPLTGWLKDQLKEYAKTGRIPVHRDSTSDEPFDERDEKFFATSFKEEPGWKIIKSFQGSNEKTTEMFKILSESWRVRWLKEGMNLLSMQQMPTYVDITIRNENGKLVSSIKANKDGVDVSYVHTGNQNFYLEIAPFFAKWKVNVEIPVGKQ